METTCSWTGTTPTPVLVVFRSYNDFLYATGTRRQTKGQERPAGGVCHGDGGAGGSSSPAGAAGVGSPCSVRPPQLVETLHGARHRDELRRHGCGGGALGRRCARRGDNLELWQIFTTLYFITLLGGDEGMLSFLCGPREMACKKLQEGFTTDNILVVEASTF